MALLRGDSPKPPKIGMKVDYGSGTKEIMYVPERSPEPNWLGITGWLAFFVMLIFHICSSWF